MSMSVSFPPFPTVFPSTTSILLSILATLVLLAAIRAVSHLWSFSPSHDNEKGTRKSSLTRTPTPPATTAHTWSWAKGWSVKWESLPLSLPLTLTLENELGVPVVGNGVGVGLLSPSVQRPETAEIKTDWQKDTRRAGPAFEHPLPAIYQSEAPVSMAKMIMSRHTFRRPTQRPPRRSTSAPPSRRQHSMV